jgi:integrase
MAKKKSRSGTGDWYLAKEGSWYSIRQMNTDLDGKRSQKRYPKDKYKHITDILELESFVDRLNHRDKKKEEAKREWLLENSFCSRKIIREFHQDLINKSVSEADANKKFNSFTGHFLWWSLSEEKDPNSWKKIEGKLSSHLMSKKLSRNSLKRVISTANKFLEYLHLIYPNEIEEIKLNPISKAQYKQLEAKRELEGKRRSGKYIPEKDLKVILNHAPKEIVSFVKIAFFYGLREGECTGLYNGLERVKKGYLLVDRQTDKYNSNGMTYKTVKSTYSRKTPHWRCEPGEIHRIIEPITAMTPHTLSRKFSCVCSKLFSEKSLSQNYTFHDLRHSYITDMVKVHNVIEVQMAVGHADLQTTNSYIQDSRDLDGEIFIP